MATTAPEYPPHSTQTLDQLSFIDLSTLTQSELLALSRCSSVTASAANCFPGGTAVASIDRSAFNESIGSRRQTFCRLGPSSPSSSVHHRSRVAVAGRLSSSSAKSLAVSDAGVADTSSDPHHGENRRIIANLKQSLRNLPEFYDIDFDYVPPCSFTNPTLSLCDGEGEGKRKRGRKPKPKPENFKLEIQKPVSVTVAGNEDPETGLESVNKNGVRVDLAALSTLEDPYGPEIRRRTEGLCGEEELLGFLSSLGGEWCSRRRKRKIVDAGVLGDFLPVGWKLLLALKRKERRAWVYCRRIVSPGGMHLLSCKEVSEYLRSYFESHGEPSRVNHDRSTVHPDGPQSVSQIQNQDANCGEDSRKYHSLITVSGNDNLKVIQVQNLFKCQKCNSTFDTNDAYLQHLISVHQENTKRCKLGSSVEGGQTITNGNQDEGVEQQYDQLGFQQTIEPTIKDDPGMRISRMDALIEIAHNSMLETSSAPPTEATERLIMFDELNLVSEGKRSVSDSEHEMISPVGVETEDGLTITNLDQGFPGEINGNTATGEKVEILEHVTNFMDIEMGSHRSEAFPEKHGFGVAANGTEESVFGNKPADEICLAIPTENQEALGVSMASPSGDGNVNNEQAGLMRMDFRLTNDTAPIQESIQFQLQPTQDLQTYNVSKGEDKSFSINPSNELQLEYMESLKLNFVGGTDMSLVPMGLEESTAMVEEETAYGSAPQFQPQEVALGMTGGSSGNNLTAICMWCGIEFSDVSLDSEPRSDSVGYMCLACKARISGQIGTPDAPPPPTSTIF